LAAWYQGLLSSRICLWICRWGIVVVVGMATVGDNQEGGAHRGGSTAAWSDCTSVDIRTSGAYLQAANLDDDLQGHWLWRKCLETLLVFGSAENEEEFEASWSEPALLVQPLMIYHTLWYIGENAAIDRVASKPPLEIFWRL
jgi:hypothetical protein